MKEFDIKKGWYSKIEGDGLPTLMESIFSCVEKVGDTYVSEYGVMESIKVKIVSKTLLAVDTVNATKTFTDEEILDSKRALNKFLEAATGFNAKDRLNREKKKAKEGKL